MGRKIGRWAFAALISSYAWTCVCAQGVADEQPAYPTIPAGTPVDILVDENLSSQTSKIGDRFRISLRDDIIIGEKLALAKGAVGYGEVIFVARKGAFGAPGIIEIAVRELTTQSDRPPIRLSGRYREEGRNNGGAAAATMFAVGLLSGIVTGKVGIIPQGRVLRARTAEGAPKPPAVTAPAKVSPDAPVAGSSSSSVPTPSLARKDPL